MVRTSTNLTNVFIKAWKSGKNTVTGILLTPGNGTQGTRGLHNAKTFTIGMYSTELLSLPVSSTMLDLNKYRVIEGVNDETGDNYSVIADELPNRIAKSWNLARIKELEKQIVELELINTTMKVKMKRMSDEHAHMSEVLTNIKMLACSDKLK